MKPQRMTSYQGSADRLEPILARGRLRVGTTGDYKLFRYKNPITEYDDGLDIESARLMAKALGMKLVWVPTRWVTLVAAMKAWCWKAWVDQ